MASDDSLGNPYHMLIEAYKGDPVSHSKRRSDCLRSLQALIQRCYERHRQARNEQQASWLLSPAFTGWFLDPVLQKVVDSERNPYFVDPRNCLVFWARPPEHLQKLVGTVQEMLSRLNPGKRSTARY